jgi:hypothetical protein
MMETRFFQAERVGSSHRELDAFIYLGTIRDPLHSSSTYHNLHLHYNAF